MRVDYFYNIAFKAKWIRLLEKNNLARNHEWCKLLESLRVLKRR